MKRSIIQSALIAAALLLGASPALASEHKAGPTAEAKAVGSAKTTEHSTKATAGKTAAKRKFVDINSAGKAELKTLPGVDDAVAAKIIAGRPYLSKAYLVTQKIISLATYQQITSRIIARQNKASAAKLQRLIKEREGRS